MKAMTDKKVESHEESGSKTKFCLYFWTWTALLTVIALTALMIFWALPEETYKDYRYYISYNNFKIHQIFVLIGITFGYYVVVSLHFIGLIQNDSFLLFSAFIVTVVKYILHLFLFFELIFLGQTLS